MLTARNIRMPAPIFQDGVEEELLQLFSVSQDPVSSEMAIEKQVSTIVQRFLSSIEVSTNVSVTCVAGGILLTPSILVRVPMVCPWASTCSQPIRSGVRVSPVRRVNVRRSVEKKMHRSVRARYK
jgi:hypothetical protein